MNFLNKMNFTYVIIIVIIVMASIHLYNIKSSENFGDIPIIDNQIVGSSVSISIPTMEQVTFGGIQLKTIIDEKATKTEVNDAMPELSIIAYAGSTIPKDWQLCNGASLEFKDDNPNNTYRFVLDNTGNSIKTPDLRGRFILGNGGSGPNQALNNSGGEETHTLTIDEIPKHNHFTVSNTGGAGGLNNTNAIGLAHTNLYYSYDLKGWGGEANVGLSSNSGGNTGGTTEPHNNMPPYYVLTYIIKKPSRPPF